MALVPTLLASGSVAATGFTTTSVDPGSGVVLELDVFALAGQPDDDQTVSGLGLTWTRLDDPGSYEYTSMSRWAVVIPRGATPPTPGAITFGGVVSSGTIIYQLRAWSGFLGAVIDQAYRNFEEPIGGVGYCQKSEESFDAAAFPGSMYRAADRGSYAAACSSDVEPTTTPTGVTTLATTDDPGSPHVTITCGIVEPSRTTVSAGWGGATLHIRRALYSEIRAELFAEELFDYPAGDPLIGLDGGAGWPLVDGAWYVQNDDPSAYEIGADSLDLAGLEGADTGGRLSPGAPFGQGLGRRLFHRREQLPRLYYAFVIRRDSNGGEVWVHTSLFQAFPAPGTRVRWQSGVFVVESIDGFFDPPQDSASLGTLSDSANTFVVLRIDYETANDYTVRAYVDPTPGEPEPITPTATITGNNLGIRHIAAILDPGSFVDTIRLGEEWAHVTPSSAPPIDGTITETQSAQTDSATGAVIISGTASETQAAQTDTAAGAVLIAGTISETHGAQTDTATGEIGDVISGTITETQAAQTDAASGAVLITGAIAETQAAQTDSAAGTVAITGTITETQSAQTDTATGLLALWGTITETQGAQTDAASGTVVGGALVGTITETQSAQTDTSPLIPFLATTATTSFGPLAYTDSTQVQ